MSEDIINRPSVLRAAGIAGLGVAGAGRVTAKPTGKRTHFVETTPINKVENQNSCGSRRRTVTVCTPERYYVEDGSLYLVRKRVSDRRDQLISKNTLLASHGKGRSKLKAGQRPSVSRDTTGAVVTDVYEDLRPASTVVLDEEQPQPGVAVSIRDDKSIGIGVGRDNEHDVPKSKRVMIEVGTREVPVKTRTITEQNGEVHDDRSTTTAPYSVQ
jgi:hypothetical protein